MTEQIDLFQSEEERIRQARLLRDEGIERAEAHAEREVGDWQVQACRAARAFIQRWGREPFLIEEVRFATRGQIPDPPSLFAWGAVALRLAREGVIEKIGYRETTDPGQHRTPASLWRAR